MNKLEQKIFDEFDRFEKFSQYITKQDAARIAGKIVLEVAGKAYKTGWQYNDKPLFAEPVRKTFEDFKKEIL